MRPTYQPLRILTARADASREPHRPICPRLLRSAFGRGAQHQRGVQGGRDAPAQQTRRAHCQGVAAGARTGRIVVHVPPLISTRRARRPRIRARSSTFPRHLSSIRSQVCHRQFGAQTAFKLVWCDGTRVAALVDVRRVERTSRARDTAADRAACDAWQDDGNVLSRGKPLEPTSGGGVPGHGDERARIEAWQVHGRPRFTPNCSLCELRRTSSETAQVAGRVRSIGSQPSAVGAHPRRDGSACWHAGIARCVAAGARAVEQLELGRALASRVQHDGRRGA